MADIFREVDEELQQERVAKLWQRYGSWIVAAALAVVIGVAGTTGWRHWTASRQQERSDKLVAALDLLGDGKAKEAADALAVVAKDGGAGYGLVARLREAAALAASGDTGAAVIVYKGLIADDGVAELYRGIARLDLARLQLSTGDLAGVTETLGPILAGGSLRAPARELDAARALAAGDTAAARDGFKALADDPETPTNLRARATEMVRALAG